MGSNFFVEAPLFFLLCHPRPIFPGRKVTPTCFIAFRWKMKYQQNSSPFLTSFLLTISQTIALLLKTRSFEKLQRKRDFPRARIQRAFASGTCLLVTLQLCFRTWTRTMLKLRSLISNSTLASCGNSETMSLRRSWSLLCRAIIH